MSKKVDKKYKYLQATRIVFSAIIALTIYSAGYLVYYLSSHNFQTTQKKQVRETVAQLPKTGSDDYRAFVTSQSTNGDIQSYNNSSSGLEGANNICQDLVENNPDLSSSKWFAFINTSQQNVFDNFYRTDVAYYNLDGQMIFSSASELENCDYQNEDCLVNLVNITETGQSIGEMVDCDIDNNPDQNGCLAWTGIFSDTCNDWETSSATNIGNAGRAVEKQNALYYEEKPCDFEARIYCFEQMKDKDEDGFYEDEDCNDDDFSIYPGASEVCNDVDDDCDGQIDENLTRQCGDTNTNTGQCQIGEQVCEGGNWGDCLGEVSASSEVCDNKDNDCNGKVDENLQRTCGKDTGLCNKGLEVCSGGKWGECTGTGPSKETCDGVDNDCDGETDEGCKCDLGDSRTCGTDTGKCSPGTQWCVQGTWGACDGDVGPSAEICDSIDNDCDGQTDEDLYKSCGSDIGACSSGFRRCLNGAWASCDGAVNPSDEKCDGKDNDCDGTVDEGCGCKSGQERECGIGKGECSKGKQVCSNGIWGECEGNKEPENEICDQKDNDCDGEVDEDYICEEEEAEVDQTPEEEEIDTEEVEKKDKKLDFDLDFKTIGIVLGISLIVISVGTVAIWKYLKWKEQKKVEQFKKGQSTKKKSKKEDTGRSPLE